MEKDKALMHFACRTCGMDSMVSKVVFPDEFLDWANVEGVAIICGKCNSDLPKENFLKTVEKLEKLNKRIHNDQSGIGLIEKPDKETK